MTDPVHSWVTTEDDDHWFLGTLATVKASAARTGGVLTVVEFLHPANFATPSHVHHHADEAFYVLAGSIRGFCGGDQWQAGPGAFVWLPREVPHGYRVEDGDPVRTLAITLPGGFDRFVVDAGRRAGHHGLPPTVEVPDLSVLLAAAARDGQEILGPPPPPEVS